MRSWDDYFAFGMFWFFSSKLILLEAFSLAISFFASSMARFRSNCVGDDVCLAGRCNAPNTSNIGQRPSEPMVAFAAYTAICRHSGSIAVLFGSDCINLVK